MPSTLVETQGHFRGNNASTLGQNNEDGGTTTLFLFRLRYSLNIHEQQWLVQLSQTSESISI